MLSHNMGNVNAYATRDVDRKLDGPHPLREPTFDPNFGFPNGRKERVMIATEAQMQSAKVELIDRDYCAHKLLEYQSCRADVYPWVYKCHHEKHAFLTCQYEDYILRMKEFERERRLLERQKRIDKKAKLA